MSLKCSPYICFARYWKQTVDSCNPGSLLPAILLADKCDLQSVDERTVTAEALAELAEELHCFAYFEVSAKTGQKEAFDMLLNKNLVAKWQKCKKIS